MFSLFLRYRATLLKNKRIAEWQQTANHLKWEFKKIEMCITRSNFVVHEFDFDILFYTVRGNIYMPNFEVSCTVV